MALSLVTAPTVEPISLDEAKKHLRVDFTDDDNLIQMYIKAATDYADGEDGFLGRCLVTQTWQLTLDAFPTDEIKIPLPPLQSVVSVGYDDPSGNGQTFDPLQYYVDNKSEPGWVVPMTSWPSTLDAINAVRIQFIAGYSPTNDSPPDLTANIPFNLKAALLLIIGNMYEHREDNVATPMVSLPFNAELLLRRHKINLSMA